MKLNSTQNQINKVFDYIQSFAKDEVCLLVSEWAEKHRVLPKKVSPIPGSFKFSNFPYAKEIADRFSKDDPTKEIAVMKGVQLGFTTSVFENAIGYSIEYDPSPMMYVSADLKLLTKFKDIRISTMIDYSGLRDRIVSETDVKNSRKQGETSEMLNFIGGFVVFCGPRNGNALRSNSIQKLFLDELDGYPKEIKPDGCPIKLAVSRTNSYEKIRKIGYISTPTLAHNSNIYEYYKKGDQRKYLVPCPFCGVYQELVFFSPDGGLYDDKKAVLKDEILQKPFGLMFDSEACKNGNFSSVAYKCKHCGELINEHYKTQMNIRGFWKPTAKTSKPEYVSYHISALYSPTYSWKSIVSDFLDAKSDPSALKVFYNNDLGLPFVDTTAGVDKVKIHRLRDTTLSNKTVPPEALFLTAACDVQDDRLEVEIKAWGDRFRNWGIDHRRIYGNTSDITDPCWETFFDIKDEFFCGRQVEFILIDSGDGEKTDLIYRLCSNYGKGVVLPLKGVAANTRPKEKFKIVELKNYDIPLVEIYVDQYKNQLALWLNQEWRKDVEVYPDGWMTVAAGYDDKYLAQLCNEQKIKKKSESGRIVINWVKTGPNEAFDLNVYNLCAAELVIAEYSKGLFKQDSAKPKAVFEYFKGLKK